MKVTSGELSKPSKPWIADDRHLIVFNLGHSFKVFKVHPGRLTSSTVVTCLVNKDVKKIVHFRVKKKYYSLPQFQCRNGAVLTK